MIIYTLTFKSTAAHDAEKRAGLNRFLKTMLRTYSLRCVNIEETEVAHEKEPTPKTPRKARRAKAEDRAGHRPPLEPFQLRS